MRHILPISEREKGIWNDATISPSVPRYDLERIGVPTFLLSAETTCTGRSEARATPQNTSPALDLWTFRLAATSCWDTGRKPVPKWPGSWAGNPLKIPLPNRHHPLEEMVLPTVGGHIPFNSRAVTADHEPQCTASLRPQFALSC
jgi:hypothetical protein